MRAVGTKNFGVNNGIFYNYSGADYYGQRTALASGVLNANESLRREWQGSYIDLIARINDENGRVPIFTPDRKFISQDCRHLTRAGAQYIARLFESDLVAIFEPIKGNRLVAR